MNQWISILKSLELSRTEFEIVKRFEADPNGRSFLPVADILRSYRFIDESLELLVSGVVRHPTFTVARIVLVRELLQKGLVVEAWQTLEEAKTSLRDNVLAQKLRFKLATLLGYDSIARSTLRHLKLNQMTDGEIDRIGEILEISGLSVTRERMMQEMKNRGIALTLPAEAEVQGVKSDGHRQENSMPADSSAPYVQAHGYDDQVLTRFGGFQVVALGEVFHEGSNTAVTNLGYPGIELDSTTLASIYENQGHYDRAIEVYRRLLRMTPSNELIKTKLSELASKKQRQRTDDLAIDPQVADSMEQIEVIDIQMKFYRDLLTRIG